MCCEALCATRHEEVEWVSEHVSYVRKTGSKQQYYAPFYDYFFRNHNYFKELKQTYRPSLITSFTQLPRTSSM